VRHRGGEQVVERYLLLGRAVPADDRAERLEHQPGIRRRGWTVAGSDEPDSVGEERALVVQTDPAGQLSRSDVPAALVANHS